MAKAGTSRAAYMTYMYVVQSLAMEPVVPLIYHKTSLQKRTHLDDKRRGTGHEWTRDACINQHLELHTRACASVPDRSF